LKKIFLYSLCLVFLNCASKQSISKDKNQPTNVSIDYRNEMRDLIIRLSKYAKDKKSDFTIVPQNGIDLVTLSGESEGKPALNYLKAIDGHGQESLFFGDPEMNKKTAIESTAYIQALLKISQLYGNTILVIDYCNEQDKIRLSNQKNLENDFVSFAAPGRNLTVVPDGFLRNSNASKDVSSLTEISNFLYLINFEKFVSKNEMVKTLSQTNADLLVVDLFFNDGSKLSAEDISNLKTKPNGENRLVLCYMSIGEAEDYRFYWKDSWNRQKPSWLDAENPNWKGNYKVKYWDRNWQNVIFGANDSYLDLILATGFDGVYLDIVDAFQYYEEKNK
jgi:cysteinyl-tRNA synthetase